MNKQGCYLLLILMFTPFLTSCLGSIWTGGSLVYNRHSVYKKIDDYHLALAANHLLFADDLFEQTDCSLDVAVFNGDILLAGHVPTDKLREKAEHRLQRLTGYREIFKQVAVNQTVNNGLEDSWITTKIRSQIVADAEIDPNAFKIITADRIVYVMGDVNPKQATRVLNIASNTDGVIRVVKLLRYYNLSETPALAQ